ncbi:MAG: hypothetical protein DWQ36_09955 [Acidobacteria bacterium]|nr:MAG: hypothetical protein DWQ36_09955 [Acidobacteriota bacterium]
MARSKGPNVGIKLLAAGIVLGIGAAIQVTQNEPSSPLLIPATILIGLGAKILWRRDAAEMAAGSRGSSS